MTYLPAIVSLSILAAIVWFLLRPHQTKNAPAKSHVQAAHNRSSAPRHAQSIAHHGVLKGRAYVIDGDTIIVQKRKIRLAGIDAPETDMPWGNKAKWAMVQICKGQTLTVHLTGEVSYDRMVGTVYLPDGRDIGAEIVKRGLALDLPHFSGGKYSALEPEGARTRLRNGFYGHSSLRWKQRAPR